MKLTRALPAAILPLTAAAATSAADIIKIVAPGSVQCAAAAAPDCRTADQAAPFLIDSMAKYEVLTYNEIAAVLSLMAFESVDFKFKHNVSPGRPGQGTANMQMDKFNLEYAKSLPGVKDKVADVKSVDGLDKDKLNEILALVTPDEYNFGSGPWFYATKCGSAHAALVADLDKGFEAYMQCVGVTVTPERKAYLTRAKQAFGLA
ncbi:hypothetical protein CCM_00457 [Cordyceps militaris CM01]|uniref:Uncharacterized protein n=1 Tax=Cordyceps militaris (strain CM01) TaxID=983644 RepID=G3J481_CORMM|nr:uncharacterized protein CCM_00457 [Cordyceps militaris CM01]EGX95803.1 hypothetical protein CCM_00457 [Cordyceps militaris CM01]